MLLPGLLALLGPVPWLLLTLLSYSARRQMTKLRSDRSPLPSPPPGVSLIIPARNEESHLRSCVEQALAQDYPDLQVVVINDRSTDATPRVLDDIAAEHPPGRFDRLDVQTLPDGWLGKNHALAQAMQITRGEWLLFVDSDVQLAPDAASRAVAVAVHRAYDALTIFPALHAPTLLEKAMLPILGVVWATLFTASMTNNDAYPSKALANGQFFLIRRSVYEAVGGHGAVRACIVEDVELMRLMKSRGYKTRFQFGQDLARTRMHATLSQIFHGWARIFAGTARRRPWPMIGFTLLVLLNLAAGFTLLGLSLSTASPLLICLLATQIGLALLYLAGAYHGSRNSPWLCLMLPLTTPLLIAVMIYAIRACLGGTLNWRGSAVTVDRGHGL